jgi:hypothetical protein
MNSLFPYWNLVKLSASGGTRLEALPAARTFFHRVISQDRAGGTIAHPKIDHLAIQQQLLQHLQDGVASVDDRGLAALCLRCYLSHQIEQICVQLANQFGDYYGFTANDLLPYVLDDDGKWRESRYARSTIFGQTVGATIDAADNRYQPLAVKILTRFDPNRGSLATWTLRLVKQHAELNAFLLERGLYMLSDWAILNDTSAKKLQHVLRQFHHLTEWEVQQAIILLESYHAVYRRDRLLQGYKGQCAPPANSQLLEMAQLMQQRMAQAVSASTVLARLHGLADRLRQHRVAMRGGSPPTRSLDDPKQATVATQLIDEPASPEEALQIQFLQTYRQQFLSCLEQAVAQVVDDRQRSLKPPKDQTFLKALHLFHCRGLAMGDIAQQIGLRAQFQVSRLLNLKALRADVRHWMLQCLQSTVRESILRDLTPDNLHCLDQQLNIALSEQVDTLLQEAHANSKTPKAHISGSRFARSLCRYLDQQFMYQCGSEECRP